MNFSVSRVIIRFLLNIGDLQKELLKTLIYWSARWSRIGRKLIMDSRYDISAGDLSTVKIHESIAATLGKDYFYVIDKCQNKSTRLVS